MLPEIEHWLAELGAELQATDDDDEADRITLQISHLRQMRREARAKAPAVVLREVGPTQFFEEAWAEAGTIEEQRAVLDDALHSIRVVRGRVGRGLDAARLRFEWKVPEDLGPVG